MIVFTVLAETMCGEEDEVGHAVVKIDSAFRMAGYEIAITGESFG